MVEVPGHVRAAYEWAKRWEAQHPDAVGWVGAIPLREAPALEELRKLGFVRGEGTDGHWNTLYHTTREES